MLKFQRSIQINAPVETVWAFHERADILNILTPPWQPVQVLWREGGLGVGTSSAFRLWLGPLPVLWLAQHVECEPDRLFADLQTQGPMAHWLHRHRFEPLAASNLGPAQMRLTDEIEYALPAGDWTEPLLKTWVSARLGDMFAYRHRVTKLACERLESCGSSG